MYIPPDEYLNLIDQINALTYHNTRCWEDNITLGREVIKQRQLASKYRQYPWRQTPEPVVKSLTAENVAPSEAVNENKQAEEKSKTQTPPSSNRIPLNEIISCLNSTEKNVCNLITTSIEDQKAELLNKLGQMNSKPKQTTQRKENSILSSPKSKVSTNQEISSFLTQVKTLYQIWNKRQSEPTNFQMIQWINQKNSEHSKYLEKVFELEEQIKQIKNQRQQSPAEQKFKTEENTKQQIQVNVCPPKDPSKKLKKHSILKRQSIVNKKKKQQPTKEKKKVSLLHASSPPKKNKIKKTDSQYIIPSKTNLKPKTSKIGTGRSSSQIVDKNKPSTQKIEKRTSKKLSQSRASASSNVRKSKVLETPKKKESRMKTLSRYSSKSNINSQKSKQNKKKKPTGVKEDKSKQKPSIINYIPNKISPNDKKSKKKTEQNKEQNSFVSENYSAQLHNEYGYEEEQSYYDTLRSKG